MTVEAYVRKNFYSFFFHLTEPSIPGLEKDFAMELGRDRGSGSDSDNDRDDVDDDDDSDSEEDSEEERDKGRDGDQRMSMDRQDEDGERQEDRDRNERHAGECLRKFIKIRSSGKILHIMF